jgi:putative ABC transport system ATP-binding protein
VRALSGVDVAIERGELVVLAGPSGSGKTTLINVLGLLDRPDEGEVLLEGRSVGALDENELADLRRDRFGFVFQTFNLIAVLSALENVEYPLTLGRMPGATAEQRARELLERVGLGGKEHVRPDLLSGGERQRVALARAIVHSPRVILADEPTANLDSRAAGDVLDLMAELGRDHGATFVVATHDARVVERGTRVIELHDGRLGGAA